MEIRYGSAVEALMFTARTFHNHVLHLKAMGSTIVITGKTMNVFRRECAKSIRLAYDALLSAF
jgi:hypothetical protein